METYCPEIKETLKGCKFEFIKEIDLTRLAFRCGEWRLVSKINNWHHMTYCPVCISKLQTHLIHAEKDLIDVDNQLKFYEEFYGLLEIERDTASMQYKKKIFLEEFEEIQLRKTEIEEAIKEIKGALK